MSWHIYLFNKATCSTHYNTNNEYGKYYPGAAARPEYGSVFRVSLPITGLLGSWSLDKGLDTGLHKLKVAKELCLCFYYRPASPPSRSLY